MATRGRKPASKRTAQKTARPKTIDLKASDTNSAPKEKPSQNPGDKTSDRATRTSSAAPKDQKPTQILKDNSREAAKPSQAQEKSDKPIKTHKPDLKSDAQKSSDQNRKMAGKEKEPQKSGLGTLVASAVLGGVVTAGGLGIIGQAENASSIPIIGSLYSASDSGDGVEQLSTIETRTAELEGRIEAVESADPGISPEEIGKLDQRLADLEQSNPGGNEISALAKANSDMIERLSQQVSEISKESAAAPTADSQPAIGELKTAMEQLSLQVEAIKVNSGNVSAQEVQKLSVSIDSIIADLNSYKLSQEAATKQLQTEIKNQMSVAQKRVDALESTMNEKVLSRMDEVVNAADKATANEKIARSVAVSSLQSAIDNGTSYLNAVTSIETLGGESAETKRLRELASIGDIPTVAELRKSFDGLAAQLVNPVKETENDDGLINRFVASAKSLVTVRPSVPQEGSAPVAVVSRIEAALRDGKLGTVRDEWELLPDSQRKIGHQWFENLKLRDETNRLLETVLQQANKTEIQG